jgi:hypothetical protein
VRSFGSIALVLLFAACGSSDQAGADSPGVCTPGVTKLCLGPGACSGAQVCNADGKGWGTCECGTDASVGGAGGASGSAGSESGGTAGIVDSGTSVMDAGSDVSVDGSDEDSGTVACGLSSSCSLGETCVEACGFCGTRTRQCDTAGTWGEWSDCDAIGECSPGNVKKEPCAKCGTRTYICNASCNWVSGACDGQKNCVPGTLTVDATGCPPGQVASTLCEPLTCAEVTTGCGTKYTWELLDPLPLGPRRSFGHVWTGTEWYVLGGTVGSNTPTDAAKWSSLTNQWTVLPPWPAGMLGRQNFPVVFTGSEVVFWGGDGARYSLASNSWTLIPETTYPGARGGHGLVWDDTSKRLIMWGGNGPVGVGAVNDGAWLDLTSGVWTPIPSSPLGPRASFAFAWDPANRYFYVFGGGQMDGAIYDSKIDSWKMLPALPFTIPNRNGMAGAIVDGKFLAWGGIGASQTLYSDGVVYDPVSNTWAQVLGSPLDGRQLFAYAASGSKFFIWGGNGGAPPYKTDGAIYDAATNAWTKLPTSPLSGRYGSRAAWTPQGILLLGGYGDAYTYADFVRYNP